MENLKIFSQYLILVVWCLVLIGLVTVVVVETFISIKAIKNPNYKAYLQQRRQYEKDLRKMRYDYYHDVKLLKDIHIEKLARIVRGEIEDENEKEKSLISDN